MQYLIFFLEFPDFFERIQFLPEIILKLIADSRFQEKIAPAVCRQGPLVL